MNPWQRELALIGIIFFVLLGIGSATATVLPLLLTCAVIYLGWNLYHAWRLLAQLSDGTARKSPPGLWGAIGQYAKDLQNAEHKTRRKLARFDTRFRDATALFPDALVALSRSRKVRWCNQVALDWFFDGSLEQITGQPLRKLIATTELSEYIEAARFDRPLLMHPPKDDTRVLSIRVAPFGRKKKQVLLVASDITRMYHLDAARRDFVANVSHELRTPLTVITGYLDPLGEVVAGDPQWEHSVQMMQEQAARMRRMIDDLTLLSRLESEEKTAHVATVNVSELLADVLRDAQTLSIASGHQFSVDADHGLQLEGDRSELRSAISNLVLNALRHTPAGTNVHVSWQGTHDGAVLEVSDDGPGIDAEHLPRLTERFYRVDPGRSRESGGTGLGLAIVKHVLNRHDAQLGITSKTNEGSAFRCEFPTNRVVRTPLAANPDQAQPV